MKVKFKGKIYYTIDGLEGPLGTKEQYNNFEESFAFIQGGIVWRNHLEIGKVEDLEILSNESIRD